MSRVYRRPGQPQRSSLRRVVMSVLGAAVVLPLLAAGAVAVAHLTELDSPHPLLRLVIVEGDSMLPTFQPGEQLLFVRKPWQEGSIVIADIGEPSAVVKRVVGRRGDRVIITGDNQQVTASYAVPPDRIIATFCCRTGLRFAPPEMKGKPSPTERRSAP